MSRRAVVALCVVALTGAACGSPPEAEFAGGGAESTFTPFVIENLDDVGAGNAVAVDSEGLPFISAWGFSAELEEGEIPVSRPIGTANLPAVVLDTVDADGIWTRGAAAMATDAPGGVTVPFGPVTVKNLKNATAENTNGTDVTIDSSGAPHVAWAAPDGIWYGEGGASFTVEAVEKVDPPLDEAGVLGRPAVAVDDDGVPWVAWSESVESGGEVRVASRPGEKWEIQTAATLDAPGVGLAAAGPTEIGITSNGRPIVLYGDASASEIVAAVPGLTDAQPWATETVANGATGIGLSLAIDADGNPWASFYGDGGVTVASRQNVAWTSDVVAEGAEPADAVGNAVDTTGIAVDQDGEAVVAWYDADEDAVRVSAAQPDEDFQPVQTPGTEGGRYPSVSIAADGVHAYVAFQDQESQDLMVGTLGTIDELLVAQPSPTIEVEAGGGGATGSGECGEDGEIALDLVASGTAWDPTCLVAPAGEDFTVAIDDQDSVASTGVHNFVIADSPEDVANAIFTSEDLAGPVKVPVSVDTPLDEGTYTFICAYHPTTMVGTLAAVKAKGGG